MAPLKSLTFAVLAAAAVAAAPLSAEAADAEAGKKVFNKCKACHTLNGKHRVGPSLQGIIGRKAASTDFKRYSDSWKALADKGVVWDDATMAAMLEKPKKWVSDQLGTKAKIRMAFPGLKKAEDRDNVVAYIKANGGS